MDAKKELIYEEADNTLGFGNHHLKEKAKLDGFRYDGDLYKVKTYRDITKLERNGMLVYESVPGTTVEHLAITESGISFTVEGAEDAEITLELEPQTAYDVVVDGKDAGRMESNLSGKLTLSVELSEADKVSVVVSKT